MIAFHCFGNFDHSNHNAFTHIDRFDLLINFNYFDHFNQFKKVII